MSNPWTCDLGPMVLQHTGRYTLTVGLGTVADLMSFKVISLGHLQEAPQAGEPVPAPTLTRSVPSSGVAGQETTVSLYGTNMNAPTAIHVKDGTSELPVTLIEAHGVHGTIPALVATVQVDLRAVVTTTPSNYTISADLPGGATVTLSDPFVVGPETATDDAIEVTTLGLNDLRAGAVELRVYQRHEPLGRRRVREDFDRRRRGLPDAIRRRDAPRRRDCRVAVPRDGPTRRLRPRPLSSPSSCSAIRWWMATERRAWSRSSTFRRREPGR